MRKDERKAAVTAYKERKVVPGIYAMRCTPTGERWVGSARDLSTIENRLCFDLRLGSSRHGALQAAWSGLGAERFAFEEIERLPYDLDPYFRDRLLKDRLAHWCAALEAQPI